MKNRNSNNVGKHSMNSFDSQSPQTPKPVEQDNFNSMIPMIPTETDTKHSDPESSSTSSIKMDSKHIEPNSSTQTNSENTDNTRSKSQSDSKENPKNNNVNSSVSSTSTFSMIPVGTDSTHSDTMSTTTNSTINMNNKRTEPCSSLKTRSENTDSKRSKSRSASKGNSKNDKVNNSVSRNSSISMIPAETDTTHSDTMSTITNYTINMDSNSTEPCSSPGTSRENPKINRANFHSASKGNSENDKVNSSASCTSSKKCTVKANSSNEPCSSLHTNSKNPDSKRSKPRSTNQGYSKNNNVNSSALSATLNSTVKANNSTDSGSSPKTRSENTDNKRSRTRSASKTTTAKAEASCSHSTPTTSKTNTVNNVTKNIKSSESTNTTLTHDNEMSNSSSGISIKIKFRPSKKEGGMGVLYLQLIQGRYTHKVNTPYQIFPSEWDKSTGEILILEACSDRADELRAIDADLKWNISILERLSQDNKDVQSLIDIYQNFKSLGEQSLFEYIRRHINNLRAEGRLRTAETFLCALNSFIRYRGGVDLSFEMITREQMEGYQKYLKERGLAKNTISFYMRKLRAIYNMAVLDDLCQDTKPFATVYTANAPTKKRAINRTALRKIASADLRSEPKLEFARDMFLLILFLQGISFVDLAYMTDIGDSIDILTYNRHKTGSPISIFLEQETKDIINKYRGENTPYLLSILTSSDKKTARQQYLNALARINYSLEKLTEKLGLNIHLTTYTARHSWATLALANGANLDTIGQALGHKDLKTTRIYIDSIHSDAVTKANRSVMDSLKDDEEE